MDRNSNAVKRLRRVTCGVLLGLVLAGPAAAQTGGGSRHLPAGHWAWEYVTRLRDRGELVSLDPAVQPQPRRTVARALMQVDTTRLAPHARRWMHLLRQEFAAELAAADPARAVTWGAEIAAGARASTSDRLEPVRPLGGGGVWPRSTAGGWIAGGPFAAEVRLLGDLHFNDDPDGADPGQRRGGRTDNAYLSVAFPVGQVTIGRFRQHWARPDGPALLVAALAAPYPQVTAHFAFGPLTLHSLLGELDTLDGAKRYLAAHRLALTRPDLGIAIGEAILYAASDAAPSLRYLNPVEFLFFDHLNEPDDVAANLLLDAALWFRRAPFSLDAEVLLDDLDIHGSAGGVRSPTRYALAATLRVVPPALPVEWTLAYQRVSAFAYRTETRLDDYTYLSRGLGRNFADFDQLSATIAWYVPHVTAHLAPTVTLLREGEGDLRAPAVAFGPGAPAIFLGQRETTLRVALRAGWQIGRFVTLEGDVGPGTHWNADHVLGRRRTAWEAAGAVSVTLPLESPLPR